MGDGDDASQVLRSVVAGAFGGVTSCFSAAPFVSILFSLFHLYVLFIFLDSYRARLSLASTFLNERLSFNRTNTLAASHKGLGESAAADEWPSSNHYI